MNDDTLIRDIITQAIKSCTKSRLQIAEEITQLVGTDVTLAMLNAFTADAKRCHRWPAAWDRAFCIATGDDRLLKCRAELAGFHVITPAEMELLRLGRQIMARRRANRSINKIAKRLAGVNL